MHRVQIFMRPPLSPEAVFGSATHWRLGYLRLSPLGLNLVARMRFEYPPAIRDPFAQSLQTFDEAIRFSLVPAMLS